MMKLFYGILLLLLLASSQVNAASLGLGPSMIHVNALNTTIATLPSSNTTFQRMSGINTSALFAAAELALESGPMAYVASGSALVIDSSTLKIVSKIDPNIQNAFINGVAVSPDSQFVYLAVTWENSTPGCSAYDECPKTSTTRVVRLNASTQQPIDQYELDGIDPDHLAVAPDGKLYLAYQDNASNGGLFIMDFSKGISWILPSKTQTMYNSIAFSSDGLDVYFAPWFESPRVYELDWPSNTVSEIDLLGAGGADVYTRNIAIGADDTMLYAVNAQDTGIVVMNTLTRGMQFIITAYNPIALSTSEDGNTLYVIGYTMDSDYNKAYVVHKYSGLKLASPFFNSMTDFNIVPNDELYSSDTAGYLTVPNYEHPSTIATTSDGKLAFVTTDSSDTPGQTYGDTVLVYDLDGMEQLQSIGTNRSGIDVAVAGDKIAFQPGSDNQLVQGLSPNAQIGLTDIMFVKKVFPQNGTFASHYSQDYFSIYPIFTQPLDNTTVNSTTFRVTDASGNPVSGQITVAQNMAIFIPDRQLAPNTDYDVYLSKGIKSVNGTPLYSDFQWVFTTKNMDFAAPLAVNISSARIIASNAIGFAPPNETNSSKYARFNWSRLNITTDTGNANIPPVNGAPNTGAQQNNNPENASGAEQNPGPEAQQNASNSGAQQSPSVQQNISNAAAQQNASGQTTGTQSGSQENQTSPPGETGKPAGFFDGIIDFIKSIFGMR